MINSSQPQKSRREFIKSSGRLAAVSALAGVALPHVHAAEDSTVQLALIGCGGRGTGAVANALSVKNGNIKLAAMADVFEPRIQNSYGGLKRRYDHQVDVPQDRQFIGFDAYRQAMDCLRPGDVAIFTTPPAFRWVHLQYAIEKGLNVFMEKPVTVDGPTTRRMIALGEEAKKKNLKIGVGLMIRHCRGRQELYDRIQNGEIGDILAMRAYRMHGPVGTCFSGKKPEGITELKYQVQRFHSFLWASGGLFSDFYIHQVDEVCWMKNAWPIKAQGLGGRHYRGADVDQNFDTYSVEYTFADGAKYFYSGRTMGGCRDDFSSYVHGTKGSAIVSGGSHAPGRVRTFKGQNAAMDNQKDLLWAYPQPEQSPYDLEWEDLIAAIREDKPYNEVERGAIASLVTSMGRMAAHTGQEVTYDQIYNSTHEFAPGLDQVNTDDAPAPLSPRPDGSYPVPAPGLVRDREYGA